MDTGPPHVHDPKVCRECRRELPISAFEPHKSSCDGHRMICRDCSTAERHRQSTQRRQQTEQARRDEAALLRQHGYHWVLRGPTGQIVTRDEALNVIWRQSGEYYDDEEPPF